jgi:hypothetical protein
MFGSAYPSHRVIISLTRALSSVPQSSAAGSAETSVVVSLLDSFINDKRLSSLLTCIMEQVEWIQPTAPLPPPSVATSSTTPSVTMPSPPPMPVSSLGLSTINAISSVPDLIANRMARKTPLHYRHQ